MKSEEIEPPRKRQTRGIQLDFTRDVAVDSDVEEQLVESDDSDSDFRDEVDDSDVGVVRRTCAQAASPVTGPSKIVRLPLKRKEPAVETFIRELNEAANGEMTPESNTEQRDITTVTTVPTITPPKTPTKAKTQASTAADSNLSPQSASEVDFDLSTLQAGRKVPSISFKSAPVHQTAQLDISRKPKTKAKPSRPSVTLLPGIRAPSKTADGSKIAYAEPYRHSGAKSGLTTKIDDETTAPRKFSDRTHKARDTAARFVPIADSPAPEDSVSMIGERQSHNSTSKEICSEEPLKTGEFKYGNQNGYRADSGAQGGPSLLRRISSFWK